MHVVEIRMASDGDAIEAGRGTSSSQSSGYGISDDTKSIESSVLKYREENGRRYHGYKDGSYWQPNDDTQNDNADISHVKFLKALGGKLLLAPVAKNIERALDIGTGTGIWALDFADEYSNTQVIGTDLSPIQPEMVAPNCEFFVDDCRDDWSEIFPPNHFDLIHIRGLFGSIKDWPALYKQIYKHLKPGGYIEQVEVSINIRSDDNTLTPDNPLTTFCKLFEEAGKKTGCTFEISEVMGDIISSTGFINRVDTAIKTPIGGWAPDPKLRDLGFWALLGFDLGLEGYAMATLTRVLGWTPTEVHVLLAQVRRAAKDRKIHKYHDVKVVYAQKPFPPDSTETHRNTPPR